MNVIYLKDKKVTDKLVPWNLELILLYLSNMTIYYILLYIYLYLKLITIYQASKIILVCAILDQLLNNPENGS